MKKTNEEILQFFGLKIGDKVKIEGFINPFVIFKDGGIRYFEEMGKKGIPCNSRDIIDFIHKLLGNYYEISTPKKKVGEMKCKDFVKCKGCPFDLDNPAPNVCITSRTGNGNKTFIEIVKSTQKELDNIKLILDKEVEECEK